MKVRDCMCNHVNFVKPETTIKDCAKIMGEQHIGCTPVCDNQNNVVGIVNVPSNPLITSSATVVIPLPSVILSTLGNISLVG